MSNKNNTKYDPLEKMHPRYLDKNLEELAHNLFELSCEGSKPVWDEIKAEGFEKNPDLTTKFLALSHEGMREAQKIITEIIQSNETLTDSHTVLFSGIADSMGWQMIGEQLCFARRFYKEQTTINLKQSNFDSVVLAANQTMSKDPGSFSLISDLTSFVQVSDLLTMGARGGMSISEVKEGKKNHEIMELMNFFAKKGCPRSLHSQPGSFLESSSSSVLTHSAVTTV